MPPWRIVRIVRNAHEEGLKGSCAGDGYDLTAIQFVAGPEAGKFNFQIDDVKLDP